MTETLHKLIKTLRNQCEEKERIIKKLSLEIQRSKVDAQQRKIEAQPQSQQDGNILMMVAIDY